MGRRRAFAPEREEQVKHRLQRAETDPSAANPVQSEVLRLQRSGGNEAVAGVLARDDAVAQDAGAKEETSTGAATMSLEDLGDFKVLAFSMPDRDSSEVKVTVAADDPKLVKVHKRMLDGGPVIPNAVITTKSTAITLKDVYISSLRFGDGTATLTLSYASIEFDYVKKDQPGRVD